MKKKKEVFDIKEEYRKSWKFIRESRIFIYSIIIIFFAFVLIGFFAPAPEYLKEQIMKFLEEIVNKTEDMEAAELMGFIIFNNLQTSFFGMLFGFFFGLFPMLLSMSNGYILGFVSLIAVNNGGFLVLWRLFPHGIFELPAVFISLGLGLKIGSFIFQKKKLMALKEYLLNSLKAFFFIVMPLLIIAGIIEGALMFIT